MSDESSLACNITELYLIRHGTPVLQNALLGKTDSPLSSTGWEQMTQVTNALPAIDLVITSPLKRCSAFGTHFSKEKQIPIQIVDSIQEYDFGEWDGLTYSQLREDQLELFAEFIESPYRCPPPSAETLQHFNHRVIDAVSEIEQQYSGSAIALFTHAGVIRTLVAWCLGMDYKNGLQFQRFSVDYASITHLTIFNDGQIFPQLRSLNFMALETGKING